MLFLSTEVIRFPWEVRKEDLNTFATRILASGQARLVYHTIRMESPVKEIVVLKAKAKSDIFAMVRYDISTYYLPWVDTYCSALGLYYYQSKSSYSKWIPMCLQWSSA